MKGNWMVSWMALSSGLKILKLILRPSAFVLRSNRPSRKPRGHRNVLQPVYVCIGYKHFVSSQHLEAEQLAGMSNFQAFASNHCLSNCTGTRRVLSQEFPTTRISTCPFFHFPLKRLRRFGMVRKLRNYVDLLYNSRVWWKR